MLPACAAFQEEIATSWTCPSMRLVTIQFLPNYVLLPMSRNACSSQQVSAQACKPAQACMHDLHGPVQGDYTKHQWHVSPLMAQLIADTKHCLASADVDRLLYSVLRRLQVQ